MADTVSVFGSLPAKVKFKQRWTAPNPDGSWFPGLSTTFLDGQSVYLIDVFTNTLGNRMARIDGTGREYRRWNDPLHIVPLEFLEYGE